MADIRGDYLTQIALIQQRVGDRALNLDDLDPSRRNVRTVTLMAVERMKQNITAKDLTAETAPGTVREDLAGTKNAVNTAFTISQDPTAGSLLIYWQGQALTEVTGTPTAGEYSRSGRNITLGAAPLDTDSLWAYYQTT